MVYCVAKGKEGRGAQGRALDEEGEGAATRPSGRPSKSWRREAATDGERDRVLECLMGLLCPF